ncbi:DUF2293 domain-containing protein [Aspergillus novofumigatus IBT 16806]|uniref:DUF2293 domain-containing protein n=1 Tax=Aspergillus novofumigatus (strain IBT 16806) TaxID=1392255 RepID=A0A2I1CA67_ASPN1|nr:uncharacterized protein P174DRAFT_370652 [Aspergillus novofumigatus IBT 16806]PKX94481.1 hypothetical protein P174DRAFT_370652 [Aspergillus novofumigatus IBT 16806]
MCTALGIISQALLSQPNAAAGESQHANSEASQIIINTEARDVLRDLFPNIPDNDLNQIIKTAFQKGQRKVGTAVELPLARRAQLAVVAHIRHIYTDYDRLLKTTSFHEARSAVEEPTLAKLVEWRGDDENGKTVLEDVFREVVVISDDDDSDAEEGEVSCSVNRDHSIEIISSHQRAEELETRPVNFAHPTVQVSHLDISDDEPPPGFRFIPELPKKRRVDRRGFSRYHAWDRALNRYRKGTYQHRFYTDSTGHRGPLLTPRQRVQESITFDPGATSHRPITTLRHVSVDPHIASKTKILEHEHGQRRTLTRTLMENRVSLQRTDAERSGHEDTQKTHIRPPLVSHEPSNRETLLHLPNQRSDASRLADRTVVEHVSADQQRARFDQRLNSPNTPVFVGGPTEIQGRSRVPSGAMSRIPGPPCLGMQPNPQDHILQSIETPPSPQQIRRPPSAHLDQLTRRISGGFTIRSVTPRRPAPQDSLPQGESDVRIPASKRRRVANHDPATYIEPRCDVAPIVTVDTHAKQQYVYLGNASPRSFTSQSGAPIRRRYMVPVKSSYLAERYPGGSQGPSNYAQPVPEVVVDQRQYSNFKSKSMAWERQPKHQLEQYRELYPLNRSPGQIHVSSGAGYATAPANGSYNGVLKLPDTASEAGRVYEDRRIHQEAREATYMPVSQGFGLHHHHHRHHHTSDPYGASRRSIYADDFVRPIDYRDDLRLVSQRQHGHMQTTGPMDSLPGPTNDHLRHDSSRESIDLPYSALVNPPRTAPNRRGAGTSRRADDQALVDDWGPSYDSRHETYGSSLALDRDGRSGEQQMQQLGYDLDQNLFAVEMPVYISPTFPFDFLFVPNTVS